MHFDFTFPITLEIAPSDETKKKKKKEEEREESKKKKIREWGKRLKFL